VFKWIGEKSRHRGWTIALILSGVVLVCAILLAVKDLSRPWVIALQVVTALSGAALGSAIRFDLERDRVTDEAHPAIRHLFDQVSRFQRMVTRAEAWGAEARERAAVDLSPESARLAERLERIGEDIRNEIRATASSIDFWGDLAPEAQEQEIRNYGRRDGRLPGSTSEDNYE
jgi:hypothetical protein